MIFVYGTTGELIKIAPLLIALERRGTPAFSACTAQQVEQISPMLRDFGLPEPDLWLSSGANGRDLAQRGDVPGWATQVVCHATRHRRELRKRAGAYGRPLLLVHGDTFTTVAGALLGRSLGVAVAHVEAGLRSGDWRNPFPEELNRRITSRMARIHFAPGEWAAGNLRRARVRGTIVNTGANTIRDSLDLASSEALQVHVPPQPFGLASLHRFELLGNPAVFRETLELLSEASASVPILFIDHPVTARAIGDLGLDGLFSEGLRRIPRQRYVPFISLLKRSAFLFTDSGGSQEECAWLGHPCLVHRVRTERREGLGNGPVVLSSMDPDVAASFLKGPWPRRPAPTVSVSPTSRIIQALEGMGFLD